MSTTSTDSSHSQTDSEVPKKTYITFGQDHTHRVNGVTLDCDCVAVILSGGRERAFELFGPKFCFSYDEDKFDHSDMQYYPRGFIEVE